MRQGSYRARSRLVLFAAAGLMVAAIFGQRLADARVMSARAMPAGAGDAAVSCSAPHVADGDTLTCDGVRVRLFGINAAELSHPNLGIAAEPGGRTASNRLFQLTRSEVTCVPAGDRYDRYGRMVAKCATAGTPDLGAEMLREGHACQWLRYSDHEYDGLGRDCDARGK